MKSIATNETFNSFPIFKNLDSKEIECFVKKIDINNYASNEIIIKEGDNGNSILFLLDGEINILDIVTIVSFAIYAEEPSESQFWASDINNDGMINILDIVQLINVVLGE